MHYKNCRMFSAEVKVPRRVLSVMYDNMERLFSKYANQSFGSVITMIKRRNSLGDVVCKFAIRFDEAQPHPEVLDEVVEYIAKWTVMEILTKYWDTERFVQSKRALQSVKAYKKLKSTKVC